MKPSVKSGLFPWLPILAGIIGFALQSWLFSAQDDQGLLPHIHAAGILSLILLAFVLGICLLAARTAASCHTYASIFPASPIAAAGTLLGGIGLGFSAFNMPVAGFLQIAVPALGIISAVCLALAALSRLKGMRPNCLLYTVVTVFLLVRIMARCQVWGAEPQIQRFFFPLLAGLFLLMACYYRAELSLEAKRYRWYIFFSQAAVFCCLLAMPGGDWLFYLSGAVWMAADFCIASPYRGRFA